MDAEDARELDRPEAAFDYTGGRGVELAEQIDDLRDRRDVWERDHGQPIAGEADLVEAAGPVVTHGLRTRLVYDYERSASLCGANRTTRRVEMKVRASSDRVGLLRRMCGRHRKGDPCSSALTPSPHFHVHVVAGGLEREGAMPAAPGAGPRSRRAARAGSGALGRAVLARELRTRGFRVKRATVSPKSIMREWDEQAGRFGFGREAAGALAQPPRPLPPLAGRQARVREAILRRAGEDGPAVHVSEAAAIAFVAGLSTDEAEALLAAMYRNGELILLEGGRVTLPPTREAQAYVAREDDGAGSAGSAGLSERARRLPLDLRRTLRR